MNTSGKILKIDLATSNENRREGKPVLCEAYVHKNF